jgi:hypothetical protein
MMSAKSEPTSSPSSNESGCIDWFWMRIVSCIPSPTKRSRTIERQSCGRSPAIGLRRKNAAEK